MGKPVDISAWPAAELPGGGLYRVDPDTYAGMVQGREYLYHPAHPLIVISRRGDALIVRKLEQFPKLSDAFSE
jgi:hypothetical protein